MSTTTSSSSLLSPSYTPRRLHAASRIFNSTTAAVFWVVTGDRIRRANYTDPSKARAEYNLKESEEQIEEQGADIVYYAISAVWLRNGVRQKTSNTGPYLATALKPALPSSLTLADARSNKKWRKKFVELDDSKKDEIAAIVIEGSGATNEGVNKAVEEVASLAPCVGVALGVCSGCLYGVSGWGLVSALATKALRPTVTGKAANLFVILVLTGCGSIATVLRGFYLCTK